MGSLGLVELKRSGQPFQNALRNAACVTALEAGVVVDADAGEERNFLSAEARHTPVIAVRAQARLLRRDLGSPGGQELADLVSRVHKTRVTPLRPR